MSTLALILSITNSVLLLILAFFIYKKSKLFNPLENEDVQKALDDINKTIDKNLKQVDKFKEEIEFGIESSFQEVNDSIDFIQEKLLLLQFRGRGEGNGPVENFLSAIKSWFN